jgi:hypothetical protein
MKATIAPTCVLALLVGGCAVDEYGLNDRTGDDIVLASPIGSPLETLVDDDHPGAWVPLMPGSQCDEHSDCDSEEGADDGFCYRGDMGGSLVFPDEGYCTIDDGSGAVCTTDDDCPGDSHCVSAEGYRICLPACGPGDSCPAGQACFAAFGGLPIDAPACLPGNASAADGDACAGFYDCNASSECWNDIEHPGGMCSAFGCDLVTDSGCNGGTCIAFDEGPSSGTICVEPCDSNDDCRIAEGYVCSGEGYCRHPHVGDECDASADCGGAGWTCLGDGYDGGYCTQTGCLLPGTIQGCSSGSVCAAVDGTNMCIDRCPVVGDDTACRAGYECGDVGASNGGACVADDRVTALGFDEGHGTTTADASSYGFTGTLEGNVAWTTGRFGGALQFPGGSGAWVTVPNHPALNPTNDFTVSAWVYATSLPSDACVIYKETSSALTYALYATNVFGGPAVWVTKGGSFFNATGPTTISTNTWTHLAGTFDGSFLRVYVNGALASSSALAAPIDMDNGPIRIGGNPGWPGEVFAGKIDEVRVYNRAQSAAEILSDMSTPIDGS